MDQNYYVKGRNYEVFIQRSFNCELGKKNGADRFFMIDLLLNELEEYALKERIPHNRKFFKVKLYIQKALLKLMKRKKYINSHDQFLPFFLVLKDAKTADDLMKIVNKSLSKIIEIENELKQGSYEEAYV